MAAEHHHPALHPDGRDFEREREQLRQMKRTADGSGSGIQSNERRKDFGKPGF